MELEILHYSRDKRSTYMELVQCALYIAKSRAVFHRAQTVWTDVLNQRGGLRLRMENNSLKFQAMLLDSGSNVILRGNEYWLSAWDAFKSLVNEAERFVLQFRFHY